MNYKQYTFIIELSIYIALLALVAAISVYHISKQSAEIKILKFKLQQTAETYESKLADIAAKRGEEKSRLYDALAEADNMRKTCEQYESQNFSLKQAFNQMQVAAEKAKAELEIGIARKSAEFENALKEKEISISTLQYRIACLSDNKENEKKETY